MTQEEFIKVLDSRGLSYNIEDDRVILNDWGLVHLNSLEIIPEGIEFDNGGDVYLNSINALPKGTVFNNGGDINLKSLIGGWFSQWEGKIRRISTKSLLNKMISLGLFDKEK
jgi:hypothetical protein